MKKRFVVPTILAKYMNVLMTMNWRVFRKKVTTGTTVELDSSGTNLNANVRNMIMNTIADLS